MFFEIMTRPRSSMEHLGYFAALIQYLCRTEGFPLRFVGLDSQIETLPAVKIPTAPEEDDYEIVDL